MIIIIIVWVDLRT